MANSRKQGSKRNEVRKLGKVGLYSYNVTIPRPLIDELGWRERQRLVVRRRGDSIVISDYPGR